MVAPNVFDAKIIHDEDGHDEAAPFVVPESRRGCTLVVAFSQVVRQHARLGQVIDTLSNCKVDPVVMGKSCQVVFVNEFHGDVM